MPPRELLDMKLDMVATIADEVVERANRQRWTQDTELLAELLELLSVFRNENLIAHGVKSRELSDPLHVPRPDEWSPAAVARPEPDDNAVVLTPQQFAAMWSAD